LQSKFHHLPSTTSKKRWFSSGRAHLQELTELDAEQSLGNDEDDDEDDDESEEEAVIAMQQQPWKNLLEAPARAAWRVTDPHALPDELAQAFQNILKNGDRTPKQLKRAHRQILGMHSDLAEFRERERRRLVNGGRAGHELPEDGSVHPVYYGYDQTLATLKHRLLPNYAIAKRVLEECQSLLGPKTFAPKRILDFGIGCGSASAAALDVLDKNSIEWIHGIDPSQTMRDCSKNLIEGMTQDRGDELPPRITFSTSLSQDNTSSTESGGSFDLALCSYTATDLPDIMSTLAAAAMLFEKLKPGGVLVIIEPGTPDGFNSIRSVRNMLLDCCPPDDPDFEWEERCHIIAPCTHNGTCPMERHKKNFVKRGKLGHDLPQVIDEDVDQEISEFHGNLEDLDESGEDLIDISSHHGLMSETEAFNSSFCSFVHSLPSADARKKGEKFSYLVAQKKMYGHADESVDPFKEDDLTDLLARAHEAAARNDVHVAQQIFEQARDLETRYFDSDEDDLGLELIRGEEKRERMGRIIRAPIKKKGHIYIDYCAAPGRTAPGRIIRSRVTKSSSNVAPGIYSAARKSRWGGLWPDTMERIFSPDK
jgi:ribosomal protein RSM22 (predicted rRNA methylase)